MYLHAVSDEALQTPVCEDHKPTVIARDCAMYVGWDGQSSISISQSVPCGGVARPEIYIFSD